MPCDMSPQERFYTCLRGEKTDCPPILAYHFLLPRGQLERELREAGCALLMGIPIYEVAFPPSITVEEKRFWESGESLTMRIYSTPIGSLQEAFKLSPYGSEWKKEYFVKEPKDYQTMAYILEKAIFKERITDFIQIARDLGEDGIAVPMLPFFERSPFQKILIDLAGPERTLFHLYDYPKGIETLMECLCQKLEEAMNIYHTLPEKRLFWWVENVTADFTTPRVFEHFCLPIYQKYLAPLRKKGIFCMLHFDGKLSALKDLINRTPTDVVESFTLPEQGGDLELEEAQRAWADKVVAVNIPANLAYQGDEEIAEFFTSFIERGCSEGRLILELSEDLPRENQSRVISILVKILKSRKEAGI